MSIDMRARPQLILLSALFAGTSYFVAARTGFTGADMIAWKGAGVGLLALWAARHADGVEGWTVATILAAGASGDVLIESHGLVAGAVAFLIGHLLGTALYARGRWQSGWPVVVASGFAVAAAAFMLTGGLGVALYAAALGGMAGAASLGRLGRLVTAGAWLFVASDLMLFARMGPLADSAGPTWLIWPVYFTGQALIGWGAVSTLVQEGEA